MAHAPKVCACCVASRIKAMSPEEYHHLIGSNPILESMVRHGTPLTREAYVAIANAGRDDEAWTHEHEAMLPEIFRSND